MATPQVIRCLAVVVVWVVGVASASCNLILDFSERTDAAASVNPACETFEPNNDAATATPATPGERQSAALCGEDDLDLYSVDVAQFDDVTIVVDGQPELNLALELSVGGLVIDSSDAQGADESIRRLRSLGNQLDAGTALISIVGSSQIGGAKEGNYSILVSITNNPPEIDAGLPPALAPSEL